MLRALQKLLVEPFRDPQHRDFVTETNFVRAELAGNYGVVVCGDNVHWASWGYVSVCRVCDDGLSEGNLILQRTNEVAPHLIGSVCPITESVVCLGCYDNNCYLYDFTENELLLTFKGHRNWVRSVTYSTKTSILCSGSYDTEIRLWKVNPTDHSQTKPISRLTHHRHNVKCVQSREEIWPNRLLSSSADFTGRVWDLTTQKQIRRFLGHTATVYGIDLSSNGDYIVTGSEDKTVCLWDARSFDEKQTTVNVGEKVISLFCAQKRPNTIVVGGKRHVSVYDPRNLSNGPVSTWEGGETGSQIVEIDSSRFVHHRGRILRNYNGQILREWHVMGRGCCYIPPSFPSFHFGSSVPGVAEGDMMSGNVQAGIDFAALDDALRQKFGPDEDVDSLEQAHVRLQEFSENAEAVRFVFQELFRAFQGRSPPQEMFNLDWSRVVELPHHACFVGSHGAGKSSCINAICGVPCCSLVRGSSTFLWHVKFGEMRQLRFCSEEQEEDICHDVGEAVELDQEFLTELCIQFREDCLKGNVVLQLPQSILNVVELIDTPGFGDLPALDDLVINACTNASLIIVVFQATSLVYASSHFFVGESDSMLLRQLSSKLESATGLSTRELSSRYLVLVSFVDELPRRFRIGPDVDAESDVFRSLKESVFPFLQRYQVLSFCPVNPTTALVDSARVAISGALLRRSSEIHERMRRDFRPKFLREFLAFALKYLRSLRLATVPFDEGYLLRKVITTLERTIREKLELPSDEDLLQFGEKLRRLVPSVVVGPEEFRVTVSWESSGLRHRTVFSRDSNRESWLGGGVFGTAFIAVQWKRDTVLDVVALKRIPKKQPSTGEPWHPSTVAGIKREMRISLAFHHPHIVETYDSGEDYEYWYIVMELCECSLAKILCQYLDKDGLRIGLPENLACRYLLEIASGLHYLHSYDPCCIHRDLKPENLLVDDRGCLRICDFGTARLVREKTATMTADRGTFQYMAPELRDPVAFEGSTRDPTKADIYSLGVVFYEMLTGSNDWRTHQANYSGPLFDLCDKLLSHDPLQRPTAEELVNHFLLRKTSALPPKNSLSLLDRVILKWRQSQQMEIDEEGEGEGEV